VRKLASISPLTEFTKTPKTTLFSTDTGPPKRGSTVHCTISRLAISRNEAPKFVHRQLILPPTILGEAFWVI